jgi:hypothetical protein
MTAICHAAENTTRIPWLILANSRILSLQSVTLAN